MKPLTSSHIYDTNLITPERTESQIDQARGIKENLVAAVDAAIMAIGAFTGLEELGKWAITCAQSTLRQTKLPEGFVITQLTIRYFSLPGASGGLIMRVDCLTGKIEIF